MSTKATASEDREAIQQLIYRYSDSVTRADYEQMATVFADDAVWESPMLGWHFTSSRDLIEFLMKETAGFEVLIQTATNPVIDLLEPGRATATTSVREIIRGTRRSDEAGGSGTEVNFDEHGIYFDELTKFDAMWKFTRRVFVPILVSPATVAGTMPTARPIARPG